MQGSGETCTDFYCLAKNPCWQRTERSMGKSHAADLALVNTGTCRRHCSLPGRQVLDGVRPPTCGMSKVTVFFTAAAFPRMRRLLSMP